MMGVVHGVLVRWKLFLMLYGIVLQHRMCGVWVSLHSRNVLSLILLSWRFLWSVVAALKLSKWLSLLSLPEELV
jgi:hypothetical protein